MRVVQTEYRLAILSRDVRDAFNCREFPAVPMGDQQVNRPVCRGKLVRVREWKARQRSHRCCKERGYGVLEGAWFHRHFGRHIFDNFLVSECERHEIYEKTIDVVLFHLHTGGMIFHMNILCHWRPELAESIRPWVKLLREEVVVPADKYFFSADALDACLLSRMVVADRLKSAVQKFIALLDDGRPGTIGYHLSREDNFLEGRQQWEEILSVRLNWFYPKY